MFDKKADVRTGMKCSLQNLGLKQPELVLTSCNVYLSKHQKVWKIVFHILYAICYFKVFGSQSFYSIYKIANKANNENYKYNFSFNIIYLNKISKYSTFFTGALQYLLSVINYLLSVINYFLACTRT